MSAKHSNIFGWKVAWMWKVVLKMYLEFKIWLCMSVHRWVCSYLCACLSIYTHAFPYTFRNTVFRNLQVCGSAPPRGLLDSSPGLHLSLPFPIVRIVLCYFSQESWSKVFAGTTVVFTTSAVKTEKNKVFFSKLKYSQKNDMATSLQLYILA